MSTTTALSSVASSSVSITASGTTSSVPTTTDATGGDGGRGDTSSSLYLFTFLATLFLLLFVSCAIVLRSFILRRRFRRSMEEAIAAGILFTGPQTGYRKRNIGEKPVMWDVSVAPSGWTWDDMKPVAARSLSNVSPLPPDSAPSDVPNNNEISPIRSAAVFNRALRPFLRRNSSAATFPAPSSPTQPASPRSPTGVEPASPNPTAQTSQVQVSVLIQMPSPHRPHASSSTAKGKERSSTGGDWDDEEFPDVVIGVAEEPCRGQLEQ